MAVLCYTGPDGNLVYYETVPSICLADFGVLECDDDQGEMVISSIFLC